MIDFERAIQRSWQRMTRQLFASFSVPRWAKWGFAAWLASFVGGGMSFGFSLPFPNGNAALPEWSLPTDPATIIAIVVAVMLVLGLVLLAMFWIGCRGQFLVLDMVARDRFAIGEAWSRLARPANNFFAVFVWLVSLPVVGFLLLVLAMLLVFRENIVTATAPEWVAFVPWILAAAGLGVLGLLWSVVMLVYREFGVALMWASGCTAGEAWTRVLAMARARPGAMAAYVGVRLVFGAAFMAIHSGLVLATCCLAALPYANTVLTLPIWVFRQVFIVECLAQFAPEVEGKWRVEVESGS